MNCIIVVATVSFSATDLKQSLLNSLPRLRKKRYIKYPILDLSRLMTQNYSVNVLVYNNNSVGRIRAILFQSLRGSPPFLQSF